MAEMNAPAADLHQSLLIQAASGEPASARALLESTGPLVYGFVFARVGGVPEVAEDLTQATYVEAIRSARTFRGDSTLETWLCAIARRQIAKHYESERRRERLDRKLRLVATEPAVDDEEVETAEVDGDSLIEALGRLPALHRQVLVLKYLDGLSVESIAGQLDKSRVQVQSLLQRARVSLKRELHEGQSDD